VPYFITDQHPDCDNWAVVKESGELLACHASQDSAVEQMVAVSIAEDMEPGGTYEGTFRAMPDELEIGDFVRWRSSGGTARGRVERIVRDGEINVPDADFIINGTPDDPAALIRVYTETDDGWEPTERMVGHRFSTLTKIDALRSNEFRQVNLAPPAYMRAAARRGLAFVEDGFGGDGLEDRTIREARAMANGSVTADKWVRLRAWIARHLVDLDAPDAQPDADGFPSPGVVAHLLWGSGPGKAGARRAMEYADGVVARLEAENEGRSKGAVVRKIEHRTNPVDYELRETEDGMVFEGYAAIFNSDSEPLPFRERIAPGAFIRSLKSRNDIKLLWNHDTGGVLGSTRANTLSLVEDDRGLKVTASLPNTTTGRDAAELLRRGDVDAMSFGFSVPKGGDEWNTDGTERTLNEIRLHEVSIVAFPAYTATAGTATVRGLDKIAKRAGVDADALADALMRLELGEEITTDDRMVLEKVLDDHAPKDSTATETDLVDGLSMLALKKKKLQLLKGF